MSRPEDLRRLASVSDRRERIVEHLKEAFSGGHLAQADFEARVTDAENARDEDGLERLIADLPPSETTRRISDSEAVGCQMTTKKLAGSLLRTRVLNIEASMSTLTADYLETDPIPGVQEIRVDLNMSTLILRLPDDVVVEHAVQDSMSSFREYRNRYYNPVKPRTVIRITGTSRMSTIRVKRKRYWFFSRKKP